jgi:hypothetical protein
MTDEHPEVRRARQREEIRALRGTAERAEQIAAIEAAKAAAKKRPASGASAKKTPENSTHMFGHTWDDWFRLQDLALARLEAVAAERSTTTSADLWTHLGAELGQDLGPPRLQVPNLLASVSERSVAAHGLDATALVVSAETGEPDSGFFRTAARSGAAVSFQAPPKGETWTMTDEQRTYWRQQVGQLHERLAPAEG